jgi:hypothetical protein
MERTFARSSHKLAQLDIRGTKVENEVALKWLLSALRSTKLETCCIFTVSMINPHVWEWLEADSLFPGAR